MSYGLIQEHLGKIALLSKPGVGTRFTIFLPVDRRASMLNLQPTILCVDDDQDMLNLINSYFVKVSEMPLETMGNPAGVIQFLEEHPEVDIVLSDIRMPQISGWDLLTLIKEKFPLLTVLLMTGYDEFRSNKPRPYEPDHFFRKPFRFDELNQVIKKVGRLRI